MFYFFPISATRAFKTQFTFFINPAQQHRLNVARVGAPVNDLECQTRIRNFSGFNFRVEPNRDFFPKLSGYIQTDFKLIFKFLYLGKPNAKGYKYTREPLQKRTGFYFVRNYLLSRNKVYTYLCRYTRIRILS